MNGKACANVRQAGAGWLLGAGLLFAAVLALVDGLGVKAEPQAASFALQFNGTNQYVTMGQAAALGSTTFTIETWFRRDGAGKTASTGTGGVSAVPLVTKGMGEADGSNKDMNYFLGIDPATRVLVADFEDLASGANHPVSGKTRICEGLWYHAAATYDGSTWRLYLNGVLDATLAVGAAPRSDSIQHAAIGSSLQSTGAPGSGFFSGRMDEVRIWNFARPEGQIHDDMGREVATATGLVGRWGMNEGSGAGAADSTSSGVNGNLVNAPQWVSGSPLAPTSLPPGNYGVQFTSTAATPPTGTVNDYLTLGPAPGLGAATFTLETWFKRNGAGVATSTGSGGVSAVPLVTKGRSESDGSNVDMNYFLGISSTTNTLVADFEEGISSGGSPGLNHPVSGATAIPADGTWHHAAATYDGRTWKLYLDGVLDGQVTLSVARSPRWDSIQHAAIGTAMNSSGTAAGFFNGVIDEVRIWNYARSAQQISGSRDIEIAAAEGLLGRWGFNETCGMVMDSTGNGNHGTPVGTGWAWVAGAPFSVIADQAPVVDAGADQTITWPAVATLVGSASDDGLPPPSTLAVTWSKVSGPGGVTFAQANSAQTTATFSAPGAYVLRLTANDTLLTSSDEITITTVLPVTQPPGAPVLTGPANGGGEISTSATLGVQVTDPDSPGLTVTFYGRRKAQPAGPNFTIIALPDTQYYTSSMNGGTPGHFTAQTQWIVDNLAARNIVFVTQLGDCTQRGDNGGNPVEWNNADTAIKKIEDPLTTLLQHGIPFGIAVGNHDQSPQGSATGTTNFFNQYFGEARFAGRPYYGGHYGSNNDNHYELFSASELDFIIVHFEYDPSANSAVLAWANQLLQTHSQRRAIVVSHHIINAGFNASFSTQGQAIYNALRGNANLFLMLSGHVTPPEGQRQDTFNGNTVTSLMSDYQDRTRGGDGWLRILEFSPANNQIQVKTYSPTLGQFETDADSEFIVNYTMSSSSQFAVLGTQTDVAPGSNVNLPWSNLATAAQYEWYATVSDGATTTTGPVWTFTTTGAPPSAGISISDASVTEGNSGTKALVFTATLSAAAAQTVTVNYATANGTASAGSDYTAKSGTLTFAAGVTTQTVSVSVSGDTANEDDEGFVVNLSGAANATIVKAQGAGTIANDDPLPSLTINDVSVTEGNTGTSNATFTVTLSAASGKTVSVNFATANGSAGAGSDYTAKSGTLMFAAGATTQTIAVAVTGETAPEATETFVVNLTGASNATIADVQGTGTIVDDDSLPGISISDVTIIEGNAGSKNIVFTVTLSTASAQTVTVQYATANGTANSNDYTAKSGTVTFAPGVASRTITIAVLGDRRVESNETFFVNLSAAVNAVLVKAQGVGTIQNND